MVEAREVNMQRMRVQFLADMRAERTEEAALRREADREERVEKIQFDMTKWDLYRIRVDQIDEKWHEFKKRQMKILWWNCIIMRHFACKKAKYNFDEHLRLMIKKLRERLLIFKIGYHFSQHMKMKAPTLEERTRQLFRNSMSFLHFSMEDRAEKGSKLALAQFFKDVLGKVRINKAFKTSWHRLVKPLTRFRELNEGYDQRKIALDAQFMRERQRMSNYYREKMKKNKKLKANLKSLETLQPRFREIILDAYQNRYVYNLNLKAAIQFTAMRQVKAGPEATGSRREWPEEGMPHMYTQEEYRSLVIIERNLKNVSAFLFKGVKEPTNLIGDDGLKPELYDAFVGAKTIKKQNESLEMGSVEEGEERKGSIEPGDDEEGAAEQAESPSPSPQREVSPDPTDAKTKSPPKTSGKDTKTATKSPPAKGKGKSGSPSKKGSKSKKKKVVDDVDVSREVNMDVPMPRYNNVMPSRKIM